MKVHYAKLLNVIQYKGEEPKVVRELLISPLPTVEKDDLLIVPEKVAKFLSRPGSPFEMFDIENIINDSEIDLVQQVSDDAVARVSQLEQSNLELENQLKIKTDELEAYELRENQEMEELKALNAELNKKLTSTTKKGK
jgi:hypothetical protein